MLPRDCEAARFCSRRPCRGDNAPAACRGDNAPAGGRGDNAPVGRDNVPTGALGAGTLDLVGSRLRSGTEVDVAGSSNVVVWGD